MHARIDELLSLRDGEPVDAEVRAHAQHCDECQTQLAQLAKSRAALNALPTFAPPEHLFERIAEQAAQRPPHRRMWAQAAAAAAIVIGVIALVAVRDATQSPQLAESVLTSSPASTPTNEADVQKLMAQSRELDELLQYLPERPQVERVSFAATVDTIEERIQVLDWQLAYGSDAGLDHQQARRLWSERVELMDSLVKVRYAESAPMTF